MMSQLHHDENGLDIHYSVEPIQVEALQQQPQHEYDTATYQMHRNNSAQQSQ